MASAYMGPERHRPLAVISESYRGRLHIPQYNGDEEGRFSFGDEHERSQYHLLDHYLELNPTDRLVYVGDLRDSPVDMLVDMFCLVHPVQSVLPGHFHYAETEDGSRVVPIRIAHLGAEEFFRNLALDPSATKLDKILIKDCVRYLADPKTTFKNMMASLAPDGKIVIMHRSGEVDTLPYFQDAKIRIEENELPYADIITHLQMNRLDVTWELECLPVRMSKLKWLSMVKARFPPHLSLMSDAEILSGLRELTEGIFKYESDMMEFVDRLLFITAKPCQPQAKTPSLHRNGAELMTQPEDTPLKYVLKMKDDDLKTITCQACARDL